MSFNHLEQLVAEWLEYKGYFVRRNIRVGKLRKGGYKGELDIVAFHPQEKKLVHYETSTDTSTWSVRESQFKRKFEKGNRHARKLFSGFKLPQRIDQYAVFAYASDKNHKKVGGGKVLSMEALLINIVRNLKATLEGNAVVPEQYPLLRMIQFAYIHKKAL